MCRRSPPGRQVVLERLQRAHFVVQAELARRRERPVKGLLDADVLVERRQARLDPRGRIRRGRGRVRHGDGVKQKRSPSGVEI